MGYRFPDSVAVFKELLNGRQVGEKDGAPVTLTAMKQLTADFPKHLPVVHVRRVGGAQDGVLRTDRIAVDTYAVGSTATGDYAQAIDEFLVGSSHESADGDLIDGVGVEVIPTEIPYASDTVNRVSATYRADTRGL